VGADSGIILLGSLWNRVYQLAQPSCLGNLAATEAAETIVLITIAIRRRHSLIPFLKVEQPFSWLVLCDMHKHSICKNYGSFLSIGLQREKSINQ
jgi:hypothetical protein